MAHATPEEKDAPSDSSSNESSGPAPETRIYKVSVIFNEGAQLTPKVQKTISILNEIAPKE
jgi:hypothetical protein